MEIDAISSFLAPITVGFIAAYLGSRLALSKFKKEKLRDERKEIYKEIIEAFEELSCWSEYQRASHCCESTINVDVKYDEPLRVISKRSAIGGLFLSDAFQKRLSQANEKLVNIRFEIHEDSMPDMYTAEGRAEWLFTLAVGVKKIVDEHLLELISIARSEMPK
ncbi:hypothetical protein [Alishewanella longhuensis]